MFFQNYLLYKYNDVVLTLVNGLSLHDNHNYLPTIPFVFYSKRIEPLDGIIRWVFFKHFDTIVASNLLILFYFFLCLGFSYLLFKKFFPARGFALLGAVLLSVNIYTLYRAISLTTNLYQVFVFPLLIYLLFFKKTNPIFLGIFIFVLFNLSAYYAFFCFLLVVFWYFVEFILEKESTTNKLKLLVKKYIKLALPLSTLLVFFSFSLITAILPLFGSSNATALTHEINMKSSYRPIENFYNFSFRPWYFFIPPKNSAYFSKLSTNIYEKIQATNYYLANDYTEQEAAGSYMGWHFLLGGTIVATLIWGRKFIPAKVQAKFSFLYEHTKLIKYLTLVTLLILLFSHPPSFTISGITFYTPTYILYFIIPIFRTMVRWAYVLYMFMVIINLLFLYNFYLQLKSQVSKILLVVLFIFVTYLIFALKLPVVDVTKPPVEVAVLRNLSSETYNYAVYPVGDYYSMFWILHHKKNLINPINFINPETGFNANTFSEEMFSSAGLQQLHAFNVKYIVVYSDQIQKSLPTEFINANFTKVFATTDGKTLILAVK